MSMLTAVDLFAKDAMHMLGNAVCPPVAMDIIASIMEAA